MKPRIGIWIPAFLASLLNLVVAVLLIAAWVALAFTGFFFMLCLADAPEAYCYDWRMKTEAALKRLWGKSEMGKAESRNLR